MSLWGNKDLVCNGGSIAINMTTGAVTGSGTTFNTAGFIVSEGDVLIVGAGATFGHAVVESVTNDTSISVATTQYLITNPDSGDITSAAYIVTQQPISSIEDVVYQAPEAKSNRTSVVVGIDTTEQSVANAATGDARKYAPPHAGWVGITTYTDMHGNLRVKTETLVAKSDIVTDRDDDAQYPDS